MRRTNTNELCQLIHGFRKIARLTPLPPATESPETPGGASPVRRATEDVRVRRNALQRATSICTERQNNVVSAKAALTALRSAYCTLLFTRTTHNKVSGVVTNPWLTFSRAAHKITNTNETSHSARTALFAIFTSVLWWANVWVGFSSRRFRFVHAYQIAKILLLCASKAQAICRRRTHNYHTVN